jgi:hypothetical protein
MLDPPTGSNICIELREARRFPNGPRARMAKKFERRKNLYFSERRVGGDG